MGLAEDLQGHFQACCIQYPRVLVEPRYLQSDLVIVIYASLICGGFSDSVEPVGFSVSITKNHFTIWQINKLRLCPWIYLPLHKCFCPQDCLSKNCLDLEKSIILLIKVKRHCVSCRLSTDFLLYFIIYELWRALLKSNTLAHVCQHGWCINKKLLALSRRSMVKPVCWYWSSLG